MIANSQHPVRGQKGESRRQMEDGRWKMEDENWKAEMLKS
jgi:hypothetical protein